jgi:hypothetical protein
MFTEVYGNHAKNRKTVSRRGAESAEEELKKGFSLRLCGFARKTKRSAPTVYAAPATTRSWRVLGFLAKPPSRKGAKKPILASPCPSARNRLYFAFFTASINSGTT